MQQQSNLTTSSRPTRRRKGRHEPRGKSRISRRAAIALLFVTALTSLPASSTSSRSQSDPPLGIPVPSEVTPQGLLSRTSENGDGRGLLPGAGACDSARHRPISLPADDGPHNGQHIEWWWWYGHLLTEDGRPLAYMLWFAAKPWANYYWTEYTVTDLSRDTFHYDRQPLILGRPKAIKPGVLIRAEHSSATSGDGRDALHFDVDGYELDLALEAVKPAVIEFEDGFTTFYCNSLFSYSRVRVPTIGTLKLGGKQVRLSGSSHFIHQWGFAPGFDTLRYNHFTFELEDGRDIYIARLRAGRNDGDQASFYAGSISDASGHTTTLHRGDFDMRPTRYWRRDSTCRYPVEWDVDVKGLHLHVRPSLEHAELRATRWPEMYALWPEWPAYWTGETRISGDATGRGWLEDGGYCLA